MGEYYLDIETTGLEPKVDKIITIQWQELERGTGKALGELTILREWELGEDEVLHVFAEKSGVMDEYPFAFVGCGYNLLFEHNFLMQRSAMHGFEPPIDILSRPFLDLRTVGVLMNKGEFKGSGLDKITAKKTSGLAVLDWYRNKEYSRITDYIIDETNAYVQFNVWLHQNMPAMRERFKSECITK